MGVCTLFALLILALSIPASVCAQGPGVRQGKAEFHPRLNVSLGYDSNFWRESDSPTEGNGPVNPVRVVKFGGGIGVKNRNPNRAGIELDLDAIGRYVSAEKFGRNPERPR